MNCEIKEYHESIVVAVEVVREACEFGRVRVLVQCVLQELGEDERHVGRQRIQVREWTALEENKHFFIQHKSPYLSEPNNPEPPTGYLTHNLF